MHIMGNKSLTEKEYDRRTMLASYLYDVSKLLISGVGIGGLSPIVTGEEMTYSNYMLIAAGVLAAYLFAYSANMIMKNQIKKK